jgi:hypothetical protein
VFVGGFVSGFVFVSATGVSQLRYTARCREHRLALALGVLEAGARPARPAGAGAGASAAQAGI